MDERSRHVLGAEPICIVQPAAHLEQVSERDRTPGVVRGLPLGNIRRSGRVEPSLRDEHPDEGVGDALCHGPGLEADVGAEADFSSQSTHLHDLATDPHE